MPKPENNIEYRSMSVELRTEEEDGKKKIVGHAAVFKKWSATMGFMMPFREKIAPGAFSKTIKNADIHALINHDPNLVLGRNTAGTLELDEDKKGLHMEVDPPDTQYAKDLMVSIERGDISQQSIGFFIAPDGETWRYPKDKPAERTITEVELFDVSVVTKPAYKDTDASVALRSLEAHREEPLEANATGDDIETPSEADATGEEREEVEPMQRPDLTDLREREIKRRLGVKEDGQN